MRDALDNRPLGARYNELRKRVAELEKALEHARAIADAERRRADANEEAYRRAIRVSLGTPTPPPRRTPTPVPVRTCQTCDLRFQARRRDARYCSQRCQEKAWRRQHPDRRAHAASGRQEDRCANP